MWHCAVRTRFPPHAMGPLQPFALVGWSGVDLFFALSGFLITRLLLQEEGGAGGRIRLGAFYARRSLRIFPAFYLVLALNLLVFSRIPLFFSASGSGAGGPLEVAALLTYWSNYYYAYLWPTPAPAMHLFWSLCVEEHFYLLWPLFMVGVRRPSTRILAALAVCAGLLALRAEAAAWEIPGRMHILSHFRFDSILWGALAALTFGSWVSRPVLRRAILAAAALAVVLAVATGILGMHGTWIGHSAGLSLLAILGAALAVETTAAPDGILARALGWPALRAIGRVSYGMYLLHFPVIDLVSPQVIRAMPHASPTSFAVLFVAVAIGTFAVAALMYRFYERPFLALKARYTPARQTEMPAL